MAVMASFFCINHATYSLVSLPPLFPRSPSPKCLFSKATQQVNSQVLVGFRQFHLSAVERENGREFGGAGPISSMVFKKVCRLLYINDSYNLKHEVSLWCVQCVYCNQWLCILAWCFKCKFDYYSGTVRPTDQETVAMEFVTDSFQAEGPSPATQGHVGQQWGWSEGIGNKGDIRTGVLM